MLPSMVVLCSSTASATSLSTFTSRSTASPPLRRIMYAALLPISAPARAQHRSAWIFAAPAPCQPSSAALRRACCGRGHTPAQDYRAARQRPREPSASCFRPFLNQVSHIPQDIVHRSAVRIPLQQVTLGVDHVDISRMIDRVADRRIPAAASSRLSRRRPPSPDPVRRACRAAR